MQYVIVNIQIIALEDLDILKIKRHHVAPKLPKRAVLAIGSSGYRRVSGKY